MNGAGHPKKEIRFRALRPGAVAEKAAVKWRGPLPDVRQALAAPFRDVDGTIRSCGRLGRGHVTQQYWQATPPADGRLG